MDEFVIEWQRGQPTATITAPNGSALKSRVAKLNAEYPEDYKIVIENNDGSILAHVPVKYIKLQAPRLVNEKTLERLREYRERKRSNSALNVSDDNFIDCE